VIVALALVALFGFCALAVDYGQMVWRKNQLQRACDAAAFAGASQLPDKTKAQQVAGTVAAQNGVASPAYAFPDAAKKIQVSATQRVQYRLCARAGIQFGPGGSFRCRRARGVAGAVPLTMTPQDFNTYKDGASFELQLIDDNRQDFTTGTMAALDLRPNNQGKSPAIFQRDLTAGYEKIIYYDSPINNGLNASLSSQGANLLQAMNQRFADAAAAPYADTGTNYTFPNYPTKDRRIIPLIVADPLPAGSAPTLTARALVPVYVESVRSPDGTNLYMRMRILSNRIYNADDPDAALGNSTTPDTGFASVRLVG